MTSKKMESENTKTFKTFFMKTNPNDRDSICVVHSKAYIAVSKVNTFNIYMAYLLKVLLVS